jgi:hypothetical protein
MITRKPIFPLDVERGAQALWEEHRELEGRVLWDDAVEWARDPYRKKVRIVLEAVFLPNGSLDKAVLEVWKLQLDEAIGLI